MAESKYYTDMMNDLRPSYRPPNRRDLADKLLDREYEKVETAVSNKLSDKNLTLTMCIDGWTSVTSKPITAVNLKTDDTSFLITAKDAGDKTKTSEYCLEELKAANKIIKDKYKRKVSTSLSLMTMPLQHRFHLNQYS